MTTQQQWESASVEEKKVDFLHNEGDNASVANVLVVTPEDVSVVRYRPPRCPQRKLTITARPYVDSTGQASMSIDRQEVASHPRLGVLPPSEWIFRLLCSLASVLCI